ncbi:MAG: 4Fe-4S dicluster domain-containing protein [Thermoplasmata archaeon]
MQQGRPERGVREESIGFPTQYGPVRSDKKPGHALMPHEVYRDVVIILIMTGVMFILTGIAVPELGKSANPNVVVEVELPDWYLLWSWGLLKISELFPPITIFGLSFSTLTYGALLSGVPFILILILPFIDKGSESRPAKSNVRAAIGVAGIVWVVAASIYSVNVLIIPRFTTADGTSILSDDTLKWLFVVEPVLAGLVTYVALRRLAFKPMRRINTLLNVSALVLLLALTAYLLIGVNLLEGRDFISLLNRENLFVGLFVGVALSTAVVALFIVYFLDEHRGRRTLFLWMAFVLALLTPVTWYLMTFEQGIFDTVQTYIMTNSHVFIALPIFSLVVTYFGQRTPYSDYEFKLNECYQCGRCHIVCPITKVEADALGGLNLVYNVYKRQHDGVPMWSCLTCDACSAVCPLDINYSAYVLTERAKVMKAKQRIPVERPTVVARPTAANGGMEGDP